MKSTCKAVLLCVSVLWSFWLSDGGQERKGLREYGTRSSPAWCKEGSLVLNKCEEHCRCKNGKLVNCFRVRKEFTRMDIKERKRYINAYKTASVNARFKLDYQRIVAAHINAPDELLHTTPVIFFPWHRWFLVQFENLLRRIDCRVTLPYWDWSRVAHHWWRGSRYKDIWNPGQHGLGGDGHGWDQCVEDGPFSKDKWKLLNVSGGGCLRRNFKHVALTGNTHHLRRTLSLPLKDFLQFEDTVRNIYHGDLHDLIRGTMWTSMTASNAPEMVLHHSFLDKLWAEWQKKGQEYIKAYYPHLPSKKMPGSNYSASQWIDSNNLPGHVKVIYED